MYDHIIMCRSTLHILDEHIIMCQFTLHILDENKAQPTCKQEKRHFKISCYPGNSVTLNSAESSSPSHFAWKAESCRRVTILRGCLSDKVADKDTIGLQAPPVQKGEIE